MGWGRMLLLGNVGQQLDIEDQQREIENLKSQVRSQALIHDSHDLNQRLAEVEAENGELRLYLAALIRYLGNKGVLDKNDFGQLIDAIDTEDGSADGRYEGRIKN
jgi:hypothetical protein